MNFLPCLEACVKKPKITKNVIKPLTINTTNGYVINPMVRQYEINDLLGNGNFSEVRRAVDRKTNKIVAIKILNKRQLSYILVKQEAEILKKLNHPNIIKLLDFHEDYTNNYIILEFIKGPELFEKISNRIGLKEPNVLHITKQLLSAIKHCHDNKIVHRDIKLENILVSSEKNGLMDIKLIDFGLATSFQKENGEETVLNISAGTVLYFPPEIVKRQNYNEKIDIWSSGIVLYVLLCGNFPSEDNNSILNDDEYLFKKFIKKEKLHFNNFIWGTVSNSVKDFIKQLLTFNPSERPSIYKVMEHEWVTGVGEHEWEVVDKLKNI